jgi:hypothetical protein
MSLQWAYGWILSKKKGVRMHPASEWGGHVRILYNVSQLGVWFNSASQLATQSAPVLQVVKRLSHSYIDVQVYPVTHSPVKSCILSHT